MNILITGGAGFIGSHIVDSMIRAGHYVSIVDNLSTDNITNVYNQADFHNDDICLSNSRERGSLKWKTRHRLTYALSGTAEYYRDLFKHNERI